MPNEQTMIKFKVKGNKTIVLSDRENEVVLALARFGAKETWFNGWEKDEGTGADGEVSTHSDATQANPTFSREDLGAVPCDAKVQQKSETANNPENQKPVTLILLNGELNFFNCCFISFQLGNKSLIRQECHKYTSFWYRYSF